MTLRCCHNGMFSCMNMIYNTYCSVLNMLTCRSLQNLNGSLVLIIDSTATSNSSDAMNWGTLNFAERLIDRKADILFIIKHPDEIQQYIDALRTYATYYNSPSIIEAEATDDPYTLIERIKTKYGKPIDILILNHLSSYNNRELLTLTSIVTRHVMPDMVTNQFGKIVYIEDDNDNNDTSCVEKETLNRTGLQLISDASKKELSKHNIHVSRVLVQYDRHRSINTDDYDYVLDDNDYILDVIDDCVVDCIDYGIKTYVIKN